MGGVGAGVAALPAVVPVNAVGPAPGTAGSESGGGEAERGTACVGTGGGDCEAVRASCVLARCAVVGVCSA